MNAQLLRYAIENIWCNPAQDRQFVYQLAKLSGRYGVRNSFVADYVRLRLPTQGEYYHIYQLGKVLPANLNIPPRMQRWYSLAELGNERRLYSDVYVNNGLQFPRFETFVFLSRSDNLFVAVRINPRITDLEDKTLYLRFYSNAYFESQRSDNDRVLTIRGKRIESRDGLLKFQREMADIAEQTTGATFHWVNGRFVNNVSLVTAQVGDVVESIFDSSVKRVVEFPITELPVFTSTLDKERKYLLHYQDPTANIIDYLDDIDVFLVKKPTEKRFSGVYYHHNETDWLRMVTHKDYAIPVERLTSFLRLREEDSRHLTNPETWPSDLWNNLNELHLRLYIRHSGYERPLVANANRIQELYKLSDDRIVRAMVGDDAAVPLWKASELEQCPYIKFMSASPSLVYPITFGVPEKTSEGKDQAQEFVGDVFGYHAAATILAGTPNSAYTKDGVRYANLAFDLQRDSTVFEYDRTGNLLGWYHHVAGMFYICQHANTHRVEAIAGQGGNRLSTTYGTDPVTLPTGYNYRLYIKDVWKNEPIGEWTDITELSKSEKAKYGWLDYNAEPMRWMWSVDPKVFTGAVRTDQRFLCKDFQLARTNGMLRFSITSEEVHDGVKSTRVLDLPFGQLDLWMNGRALIEGIDYHVNWPQVVVVNQEYLNDTTQFFTLRGFGLADNHLKRLDNTETGYVEYGVLSTNGYYDIHNNKVVRIIIDGHYHSVSDVVFDEENNNLTIANERNGAPYCLQTPPVIFHDVYTFDWEARREDDQREALVSGYLDNLLGERVRPNPDFIQRRYMVISPFANKLLHDLQSGDLYPKGIEDHYSERDIRQWCQAYEWLLPFDPSNTEYDQEHLVILPHWFNETQELTLYQHNFFVRALATYLRYPPNTATSVKIKES